MSLSLLAVADEILTCYFRNNLDVNTIPGLAPKRIDTGTKISAGNEDTEREHGAASAHLRWGKPNGQMM